MSDGLRAALAFGGAALLALVAVPLARQLALRTGSLDRPGDYRGHATPTPYLGGLGVLVAFAVPALALGALDGMGVVVALAALLGLMGAADDRHLFKTAPRLLLQTVAALVLWLDGIHWEPLGIAAIDLPLTLLWVVGLTNAFNLLDNIDGVTGTAAAVGAAGIAAIAQHQGDAELAAAALALSGACTVFLLFNFSSSQKIFLGDGGSMPLGFLIAAMAMMIPTAEPSVAVLAAVPLVALPVFDTSLVVISRLRRKVGILSGARDHSTHRLLVLLGTPARVAASLAPPMAAFCGLSYLMYGMSAAGVLLTTAAYVVAGLLLLVYFESLALAPAGLERST